MRRLPAAVLAALLLALAVPFSAPAQAIDPGTPTTIDPGTSTSSDGQSGVAPDDAGTTPGSTPPATGTVPVPPQTTTAPPATSAVPAPAATQPQPPAAQPAPAPEAAATTNTAENGGSSRLALAALFVLGALVALVLAIWGVATWQGLEPPWWPRVRHSLAEFGWRASGAWSDFTDWVRLGR